MHFETTYRLEDFILNTKWEDLPAEVGERIKGCFIDLCGALITGSHSDQFKVGLKLAEKLYGGGDIPVVGSDKTFTFMGAAAAMGHSSNAYDIDDGHSLIRAHPGTAVIGAVLAAALERDVDRDEFLTALLVSYETCIRAGEAIMKYYQNPHSSGTFGPSGIAAGVGRLYGFTREQLNNCLSIAEFNAPLVDGGRSVAYPSMNKDGVPFGVMVGTLAVQEQLCGFTGNKNLLESDEYRYLVEDLGQRWLVLDLYFKPYACCRWAHPAIDAVIGLMRREGITPDDIESVTLETFENATRLSRIVPRTADEAQYNIAYPVATAILYGDVSLEHVHESCVPDPAVVEMMKKLRFESNPKLTAAFPAHRYCHALIRTRDGQIHLSPDCEPRGESKEGIGILWLADKFRRITGPVFAEKGQERVLSMICGDADLPVRAIVDEMNRPEYRIELI